MLKLTVFLCAIALTLASPTAKETETSKEPQVASTAEVKESKVATAAEVKETKVGKTDKVKESKVGTTDEVKEPKVGKTDEVKEPKVGKTDEVKDSKVGKTEEDKVGKRDEVKEAKVGKTDEVKESKVKDTSAVKDISASASGVEVKNESSDESPIIKEILSKLDEADIAEINNEAMAAKSTNTVDNIVDPEMKKDDETDAKTKKETHAAVKENESKNPDGVDKVKSSADEVAKDDHKVISDESMSLDNKLRDVAQAVAEAVTSLPVPAKPDSFNKYTEIIGHFISELLQIPMVLLHAVSNAVASLTNNKLSIASSTTLTQTTKPPSL